MDIEITVQDEDDEVAGIVHIERDHVPLAGDRIVIPASEHESPETVFTVEQRTWTPLSDDGDVLLSVKPI
jgi:hypothetical protein